MKSAPHPSVLFSQLTRYLNRPRRQKFGVRIHGQYWIRTDPSLPNTVVLCKRDPATQWVRENGQWLRKRVPNDARGYEDLATITKDLVVVNFSLGNNRGLGLYSGFQSALISMGLYFRAFRSRSVKTQALTVQLCSDVPRYYGAPKVISETQTSDRVIWDGEVLRASSGVATRVWNKDAKSDLNAQIREVRKAFITRAKLGAFSFLNGASKYDVSERVNEKFGTEFTLYVRDTQIVYDALYEMDPENLATFAPFLCWCARYNDGSEYDYDATREGSTISASTNWGKRFSKFIRSHKEDLLLLSGAVVYSEAPNASAEEQHEPNGDPDLHDQDVELQQAEHV